MKPDNTQETIYVGLDTGLPPYLPYPRFLLKMDISQTAKNRKRIPSSADERSCL